MKIIKNPWENEFYSYIKHCSKSVKISSPFVKKDIVAKLYDYLAPNVRFTLVTSFKLMNFYRKASDIEAIQNIINNNGSVKNFHNLHSKIYLFDDLKCIITSANLTMGGLKNNFEYGLYIDDKYLLNRITKDFEEINKSPLTGTITNDEINTAQKILLSAPKERPLRFPKITVKSEHDVSDIYTGGTESVISNLEGWKLDVFKCLLDIPADKFSLNDVYRFKKVLSKKHPENRFVEPKIRQQLQVLRDIGLLEFVKRGVYRKLWE